MNINQALETATIIDSDKQLIAAFGYDPQYNEYFCVSIQHNPDPEQCNYSLLYQGDKIPSGSGGTMTHESGDTIEEILQAGSFVDLSKLKFKVYDVPAITIYEMVIESILERLEPETFTSLLYSQNPQHYISNIHALINHAR